MKLSPHETSDQQLLDAVRSGDRMAFGSLVRKYQNLVSSVAYSGTGDLGRSEDIAQQAFLIAWEKQNDVADGSRLGGWLCGIVKNLVRNDRRKTGNIKRVQGANLDDVAEPRSAMATPDRIAIEKEQQAMLWSVLERLPENYREPLILFYREHQSVESVALQMGLSEDAVKQRLSRGRSMVRNEIQSFVEGALEQTRPQESFVTAVLAALPMAASPTAAKGATGLVSSVLLKKLFGGWIMSGAVLGGLGGVLGAFVGLGGAWWGTKQAINSATSEQERELTRTFGLRMIVGTLVATGLSLCLMFMDWGDLQFVPVAATTAIYSAFIFGLTIPYTKRLSQIKREFGTPEERTGVVTEKPASLNQLRSSAIWSSSALWGWYLVLIGISGAWIVFSIALAVVVCLGIYTWKTAAADRTTLEQAKFICGAIVLSAICVSVATVVTWPQFFFAETAWDGLRWLVPVGILGLTAVICGAIVSAVERRYSP